jgi:crossover junction endodeoxyribonuclease RuvC
MRILGIDPGSRIVGFGCIETSRSPAAPRPAGPHAAPLYPRIANQGSLSGGAAGRTRLVEAGVIRAGGSELGLGERLRRIGDGLDALLRRLGVDQVALEEAFFGKSVQSALRIGEARGVAILATARADLPLFQYAPATIKRSVCGAGAASKERVGSLVATWLGLAAPVRPHDASDALAVALCHLFRSPLAAPPDARIGLPERAGPGSFPGLGLDGEPRSPIIRER